MFSIKRSLPLLLMLLIFLLAALKPAGKAYAHQSTPEPEIKILGPGGGEALQGVVQVQGTTQVQGFRSAEVSFTFQVDPTNTWFLIGQSDRPVTDGILASWDTSTITDGDYRLRVQVFLEDGQVLEQVVEGLRVRNYSPRETSTPTPQPTADRTALAPLVTEAPPTPTPAEFLPAEQTPAPAATNPAQVTVRDLQQSAAQGVAVVVGAFVVMGVYLGVRSLSRRS